ncbi:MAG: DUF5050 domain-containing protein [Christensenellaceae bacterium]|nr:DUF5050 domain-containing protein [Christensenellaceae bacterium]
MVKKIVVLLLCIVCLATILIGCGENFKTDPIPTDDLSGAVVESNGGMAVKIGKYLYYINGYAGNTVDNSFGKVIKGAIVRCELDANGRPIYETNKVIVSKNVYNTTATSGLYIQDGYIYYSTPSTDKDKNGEIRTSAMFLMRSKLDGTGTEIIAKFDDYTNIYKVVKGYVVYIKTATEIHEIDLNSKKFDDKVIVSDVTTYYFTPRADEENAFVDKVFYTKPSEVKTETHNEMWVYTAGGESKKVIIGNVPSYPSEKLEVPTGYTLTLVESIYLSDNKLRLVYTKTDSGPNTRSKGTYSYDFSSDLTFDHQKEVRYTSGRDITKLHFLDDNNLIATSGTDIGLFRLINGNYIKDKEATLIPSSATIFYLSKTDSNVEIYYNSSSVISKIKVLDKTEDGYVVNFGPEAIEVFKASATISWLPLEKIGDLIYFWNTSVKDYTYYVDLSKVVGRDNQTLKPVQLSLITPEDKVEILSL